MVLSVSPRTWGSFDEKTKQIFTETAMECGIHERGVNRQMDEEAITELQEQGMTVTYPDKQGFIDAGAELYAEWEEQFGDVMSRIEALAVEGDEDENVS